MFDIILSQFIFFATVAWLFFVPGWAVVRLVIDWQDKQNTAQLSALEILVLSFGISVTAMTASALLMRTVDIALTLPTVLALPLVIVGALWLVRYYKEIKAHSKKSSCAKKLLIIPTPIFVVLLTLTIVIKAFYLSDTMFPTATDMGHHLFWSHKIAVTGELPTYAKQKLTTETNADGTVTSAILAEPERIADFIIGEHIALAMIEIVTGDSPFTVTPVLFLFLLDIIGVLATVALALRIFGVLPQFAQNRGAKFAQNAGAFVLLLAGPLWAISGAGAKFISGGVIGNLFGNLYIPLILLALTLALTYKSARWLSVFLALVAGLIYTHHLSTFILIYILIFGGVLFAVFNWRNIAQNWRAWGRIIISPSVIVTIAVIAVFLIWIWLPSYLNPSDISSATGAPEKSTRTGLGLAKMMHTVGDARFALGLIGIGVALIYARISDNISWRIGAVILIAWSIAPLLMSTIPQFLGVNIISSRIANYVAIPFALAGGLGLAWMIASMRATWTRNLRIAIITVTLLIIYPIFTGLYDNSQSLKSAPNIQEALQTFAAAEYINQHLDNSDSRPIWVVKDHNYLVADTWMKLIFNRDYSYPLSRSYFKRYNNPTRERCTYDMITTPTSPTAVRCFDNLRVRYIVTHPNYDSAQFTNTPKFDKIYSSNDVVVFYR